MWSQKPCTHEEAKANPGMYSWCPDCGDPIEQEAQHSAARALAPVQIEPDAVRQEAAAAQQGTALRASASSSSQGPVDVAKLKELKELLDAGALTEEEFSEAKARVLHSAPAIASAPSDPAAADPLSPQFQQQPQFVPAVPGKGNSGGLWGCVLPLVLLFLLSALAGLCDGGSSTDSAAAIRGRCTSECDRGFSRCIDRPVSRDRNGNWPDPNYCSRILNLCRDSCR